MSLDDQRDENPAISYDYGEYGKCKYHTMQDGTPAWYVHLKSKSKTYIVKQEHTKAGILEQNQDSEYLWSNIAEKIYDGSWCGRYEQPWADLPVHTHILQNGSPVKFGYQASQSKLQPERELWYVSIRESIDGSNPGTFIVDKQCTDSAFLDRMGNFSKKWLAVSWYVLWPHELAFDDVVVGPQKPYYLGGAIFGLWSPYMPLPVTELSNRVDLFERLVQEQRDGYDRFRRGLLSFRRPWDKITDDEQKKFLSYWGSVALKEIERQVRAKAGPSYDERDLL